MKIKIINTEEERIYLHSGEHYRSLSFDSMAAQAFSCIWELSLYGHTFQENEVQTVMSLNQLRELRDALNKFIPEN